MEAFFPPLLCCWLFVCCCYLTRLILISFTCFSIISKRTVNSQVYKHKEEKEYNEIDERES